MDYRDSTQPIEEQVLIRYCTGQATEQECLAVQAWLAQSEEHERLLKQLLTLTWQTDLIRVAPHIHTEEAWQQISRKVKGGTIPWTSRLWRGFQQVAAVLLIPLLMAGGAIYYYTYPHGTTAEETVRLVEVRTNPGMTTTLQLPDGSTVHLNSETRLCYPSTFAENERCVSLQGEAYFEVQKAADRPFKVETPHHATIQVLGTTFNVEAFASESQIKTTLLSGKVRFLYPQGNNLQTVELRPGQQAIFDATKAEIQVVGTTGLSETAWKDGKIIFQSTPLPEALRMLAKRFHVRFQLKNARLADEAFSGTFTNQRLERILEVFKISSGIRWRYVDTNNTEDERSTIEIY